MSCCSNFSQIVVSACINIRRLATSFVKSPRHDERSASTTPSHVCKLCQMKARRLPASRGWSDALALESSETLRQTCNARFREIRALPGLALQPQNSRSFSSDSAVSRHVRFCPCAESSCRSPQSPPDSALPQVTTCPSTSIAAKAWKEPDGFIRLGGGPSPPLPRSPRPVTC